MSLKGSWWALQPVTELYFKRPHCLIVVTREQFERWSYQEVVWSRFIFSFCTWIYSEAIGQSQNLHLTILLVYRAKPFGLMGCPYFSDRAKHSSGGWGTEGALAYSVAVILPVTDDFSILGSFLFPSLLLVFSQKR